MKKILILTSILISVATTGAFAALETAPSPAPAVQDHVQSALAKTGKHKHKKHKHRARHHESKKVENK